MHKLKIYLICITALLLAVGCSSSTKQDDIFHQTVATIGNSGSTTGPHGVSSMWLEDTRGGASGFGYGAIHGYPSKSAGINIGVPKYVEGFWTKQRPNNKGVSGYYKISAPIDSQLAAKKIEALNHYYKRHSLSGAMQVIVDGPRVRVFYTLSCFDRVADCTPNEGADPHGYVERSPTNSTDVVKLFDGIGESSNIPFANSPYDQRVISHKYTLGDSVDKIRIKDDQGNIESYGSGVANPTHISAFWRSFGRDNDGKLNGNNTYYRLDTPLDGNETETIIQTMRNYYSNYFERRGSIYVTQNKGTLSVIYANFCFKSIHNCQPKPNADPNHLVKYSDVLKTNYVVIYQGRGEVSDTPFPDGPDYSEAKLSY